MLVYDRLEFEIFYDPLGCLSTQFLKELVSVHRRNLFDESSEQGEVFTFILSYSCARIFVISL